MTSDSETAAQHTDSEGDDGMMEWGERRGATRQGIIIQHTTTTTSGEEMR
jgi:hypothetical protein